MVATAFRAPAVAGMFYPDKPAELRGMVEDFMAAAAEARAAPAPDQAGRWPKAIVAPHAGYVYSGAIAARAFDRLRPGRGTIRRVVLIGPAHRVAIRGLATVSAQAFRSPLGDVRIDALALDQVADLPFVGVSDAAHLQEHCLEVMLPFIQEVLGDVGLVPFLAGAATPEQVAELLERLWGGPETAIVISSDLSHYLPYDAARRIDEATCRAIETLNGAAITDDGACGRLPVKGLLLQALRHDLRASTIDLRNSGDTAGPKDRVVGYGAWSFEPNDGPCLAPAERQTLLTIAAQSIAGRLRGQALKVDPAAHPRSLQSWRGAFVTLKRQGNLRGCIGSVVAHRPLAEDVSVNACKAAFEDPRFPRLTLPELAGLHLEVSVLGASTPLAFAGRDDLIGKLRPHVDGLILEDQGRRGLFLPQVWEGLPDPDQFLRHLNQKAGLPADHWSPTMKFWRYTVEAFDANIAVAPAA